MRSRTAALAASAALTAGCTSTQPATVTATVAASPTISASPSPTGDPACESKDLDKFLREIDAYSKRGAFDTKPKIRLNPDKVFGWQIALGAVKADADLKLYKIAASAKEAVDDWPSLTPGSLAQRATTLTIQLSAKTLAMTCRIHDRYEFSKL
ncbi:hypothetical protein AB0F17_08070 [Nonomuraea sp. NPDC026600]|uniref:hypothetical protein n=1 Tax=Nonomuraea sp. NPDC026600 TaxID=3155363 RepID=UPI0033E9B8DC